jgi:hypothetical protein
LLLCYFDVLQDLEAAGCLASTAVFFDEPDALLLPSWPHTRHTIVMLLLCYFHVSQDPEAAGCLASIAVFVAEPDAPLATKLATLVLQY